MPLITGIKHVTAVTTNLDRLVKFYVDMFDAKKVFEGQAMNGYPRMAIVELGGTRYVKIVENRLGVAGAEAPASAVRPATERFGLAVDSHHELRHLRDRMAEADAQVGRSNGFPPSGSCRLLIPTAFGSRCAHTPSPATQGQTDGRVLPDALSKVDSIG